MINTFCIKNTDFNSLSDVQIRKAQYWFQTFIDFDDIGFVTWQDVNKILRSYKQLSVNETSLYTKFKKSSNNLLKFIHDLLDEPDCYRNLLTIGQILNTWGALSNYIKESDSVPQILADWLQSVFLLYKSSISGSDSSSYLAQNANIEILPATYNRIRDLSFDDMMTCVKKIITSDEIKDPCYSIIDGLETDLFLFMENKPDDAINSINKYLTNRLLANLACHSNCSFNDGRSSSFIGSESSSNIESLASSENFKKSSNYLSTDIINLYNISYIECDESHADIDKMIDDQYSSDMDEFHSARFNIEAFYEFTKMPRTSTKRSNSLIPIPVVSNAKNKPNAHKEPKHSKIPVSLSYNKQKYEVGKLQMQMRAARTMSNGSLLTPGTSNEEVSNLNSSYSSFDCLSKASRDNENKSSPLKRTIAEEIKRRQLEISKTQLARKNRNQQNGSRNEDSSCFRNEIEKQVFYKVLLPIRKNLKIDEMIDDKESQVSDANATNASSNSNTTHPSIPHRYNILEVFYRLKYENLLQRKLSKQEPKTFSTMKRSRTPSKAMNPTLYRNSRSVSIKNKPIKKLNIVVKPEESYETQCETFDRIIKKFDKEVLLNKILYKLKPLVKSLIREEMNNMRPGKRCTNINLVRIKI